MELIVLIMLYYLSQNPDFERSVKPLLGELKNSEQALKFLEELSQFSHLFSGLNSKKDGGMSASNAKSTPPKAESQGGQSASKSANTSPRDETKNAPQSESPTAGIANGFIEELLSKYFYTAK